MSTLNLHFLDKDVAEGAVSKAVEVVLIPPHPLFVWNKLLKILISFHINSSV